MSSAVIAASNSEPITEIFTVDFTLKDIDIDLSILLGLNKEKLGKLELFSILHTENILPCILSAVDTALFTGLSVAVSDMVPPTLSGFLDSGIDQIMSNGAVALFHMYENALIRAMPNFFQTFVREMLNEYIDNVLTLVGKCPKNEVTMDGFVDFRDLFLEPADALSIGGLGDGKYGNLIPWVMDLVNDQLFSADEEGLLSMNDVMVRPITKLQSGVEGSLRMNGTFVDLYKEATRDIWSAFADKLHLRLSDLRISGVDTFREPTKLLVPKSSSGYMLENQLSLGILDDFSISQKPVEASIQFELLVGGKNSPLAMSNVIDLQLSLPSMDLLAVLYATVQESRLMQFPLEDVLNVDCWLSTIPTSKGMITDMAKRAASIDIGAAMNSLNMLLDGGMMAKTSCISCSNNMLEEFTSVLSFFIENDWVNNIQSRAISIATNMLQDEWAQDMIDREIEAASRRCPHDPNFGNIASNEAYSSFQATREIVDGALYAGMSLVQMMAIVMAQKHVDMDIPLPSDFALDIPKSAKLIDFTELSSIAGWADMVLDEARGYLGGMVESGDGKQVPGIATLLQSLVLDDGGRLTIPIVDEGFDAGGVVLSLYNVTLIGLDSFTEFNVLNTTSPQQFNNKVRLETLGCSVQMGLSVKDSSSKQARMLLERGLNVDELETITISLVFKDVEIDASIFLAMDQNLISSLKLGSILNVNHIFYCMLSTIHAVGVSQFMMHVGDINEFSISGFLSEETTNDIEDITAAVFAEYKTLILEAFPAFTSNTIRPLLHNILQVLMDRGKGGMFCPEPDTSLNGLVDFRDLFLSQEKAAELLGRGTSPYGDLFRMIYSFIEESTSAINEFGLSEINNVLVSKFTENHSNVTGDLYFPGELFGQEIDIALNGLNAAVEIAVKDVRIQSLDSIGAPIKLFEPINGESSLLNNSASIGVGPEELQASFTLFISGEGDDLKVSNELELGLSLKSVSMVVELLAEIEEMPFMNFPLQDVLNLNCWLATVVTPVLDKYGIRVGESNNGVVLRKLALAVAEARLHMNCISCSSSTLLDMSTYFSTEAGVDDTTSVANMIFEYGANILQGPFVQSQLDKMLNEAASKCPHSESYNQNFPGLKYDELIATEDSEDKFGFLIAIISVVAVSVVLSAVISLLVTFLQNRRHRQFVATLTRSQILQLEREQKAEIERQKDLNERMNPLICSSEVNVFIRFFMPIVILGNIALFLSGHLSLGGTVNLSGSFAGQDFDVEGFFEFSMAKSTIEMWEAGAKALAILIVLFSGVWPYTKQLISLVMWVVPPKRLSSGKRGKILHWLDVLGKWSMVDVFVLLTTLASFRISVESPDHLAFLPEGLYSIQMLVRPLWGLYANMLAQLVSQISSHIIIHYHRKTIRAAIRSQEIEWNLSSSASENTQPETLRKHNFKLDYEASSKRAVARKWVDWVLLVTLISFLIIVVCGCSLPSFGIEVLGLLGLAVESGNEFQEAKVYYSVFGLVKMIMDEAAYLNTASDLVGLGTLSALLVVTVFLVPLAQGASLLVQWFAPITAKQREWNATLNEILSAWQYMEVYVLSIIIAAWQLGAVSEYMINAYCEKLTPIFTTLSFYGILDKNDAQCFRVDATVETASWLLVAASILLSLLSHFIVSASTQKVKDQHIPSERRLHSDRWLATKESTLAASVDISTSSEESEDYEQTRNSRKTDISRIAPRFTDYYSFATMRAEQNQTSVSSQDGAIEVGLSATIEEDNNANDLELWDL